MNNNGFLKAFWALAKPYWVSEERAKAWTMLATVIGLVITGWVSAGLGGAKPGPAALRNVGVGVLTMAVTWGVGRLFDVAVT